MIKEISKYFSMVKFSHTVFAMPFALIGFFLGFSEYKADFMLFILIILCMIFARNSAMGFNRYLDRKIDKKNPRTENREIPKGDINPKNALIFVIVNSILFILTTYFINTLVLFLSPIAIFVILFYSFTKRFTSLCHFVLGIGLALAPIGAYLSVTGEFSLIPILFSFIVLFWVSGFDIIYALQDFEFDKAEKLKSIPVLLGKKNALIFSIILHILVAIVVVFVGILAKFSYFYWIGSLIFIGFLIYQHTLVKAEDLSKVNLAFGTTNGIASVVYGFFTILEILL